MRKFLFLIASLAWVLAGCSLSIAPSDAQGGTPFFATSTLPVTGTPFPTLSTPAAVTASVAATPTKCSERAVLLQDVTIPDNTNIARGAAFTKTWRFQNSGTCAWSGYTIAFASGDRMGAPDSAPIPDTASGTKVNVSLQLTAPTADNVYTGYFVINDAAGHSLPVGIYKNFWVRITVGNVTAPPLVVPSITPQPNGTPVSQPNGPIGCDYKVSWSYPSEIEGLINAARAKAGLSKLADNPQLGAAAQGHSIDMACHSLLSHTGSNTSTIYQRITAEGYNPVNYLEIIYAGGYPQDAFTWWMGDPVHHDAILSSGVTEFGAGYAYVSDSAYGGYYTVDFGSR
jgi:uncharacterized protein YkwD